MSTVINSDLIDFLANLENSSVDSVVTDPPYGISFRGQDWDNYQPRRFQRWVREWATLMKQKCKPGAHALIFGSTRMYHRMAAGLEDAGWEIRDCLMWIYLTGFPKGQDISKMIDKAAGAEREIIGYKDSGLDAPTDGPIQFTSSRDVETGLIPITAPATPEAQKYDGWRTALKPAWEPIILARVPLDSSLTNNIIKHSTGALNIDACRIPIENEKLRTIYRDPLSKHESWQRPWMKDQQKIMSMETQRVIKANEIGRYPSNILMTDKALGADVRKLFLVPKAMTEERFGFCRDCNEVFQIKSFSKVKRRSGQLWGKNSNGDWNNAHTEHLDHDGHDKTEHPTVKPLSLMRQLVRLVTPEGGVVLDPFVGTGTTAVAAKMEGFQWLACDKVPEYAAIANERVERTKVQSRVVGWK